MEDLFYYNKEDGFLYWKNDRGARKVKGKRVGWISTSKCRRTSYINLRVNGKMHKAHRVIWFMNFGYWPESIDHIDGDGTNNKLENLREVSQLDNNKNKPLPKNNTSGKIGVSFINRFGKWKASISHEGKKITLGYFTDLESAILCRESAEIKYSYHKNHGRD